MGEGNSGGKAGMETQNNIHYLNMDAIQRDGARGGIELVHGGRNRTCLRGRSEADSEMMTTVIDI